VWKDPEQALQQKEQLRLKKEMAEAVQATVLPEQIKEYEQEQAGAEEQSLGLSMSM